MKNIMIQLDDDVVNQFDRWCYERKCTRAYAIRTLIHKVIGAPAPQKPKRGVKFIAPPHEQD